MSDQPKDQTEQVSDALTEILGLHGSWVLAVEVYDEDGEPNLHVIRECSTIWAAMGLIDGARETTHRCFNEPEES